MSTTKSVPGQPQTDEESHSNLFPIKIEDLTKLITAYQQRTFDEDIMYLHDNLGGVQRLTENLRTNLERGLTPADLTQREQHFGTNRKDPPVRTPYYVFFIKAIDDFMLKLLLVCACVDIGFGVGFADEHDRGHAWIEGFAIFLAVFIVVFVGSYNDYKKEEQFFKLYALDQEGKMIQCRRDGKEVTLHIGDIVVGDILQIKAGMDVPVDGIVLTSSGVLSNESAMTGESDELKKEALELCMGRRKEKLAELGDKKGGAHDVTTCVLLSGTQISTGEGWFLALVVGKNSCDGKIKAKLEQNSDEMTPLQVKLEEIGEDLGKLGMYAAVFTLHILLLRFFIEKFIQRSMNLYGYDPKWDSNQHSMKVYFIEWLRYLLVAIAIIVVAVPEGLPLAVMITLAYSVRQMLIDQNFVKKLASCEIMGGANNICSDKTGTLTMNKMTVTNIFVGVDKAVKVTEPTYHWKDYLSNDIHIDLLKQAICCNTSGTAEHASATEQAMIILMNRLQIDVEAERKKHMPDNFQRFQFTSKRKRMSTVIYNCGQTEFGYDRRVHMKGAAEIVLDECKFYLNENGQKTPLTDSVKQSFLQTITVYAQQSLRTISFGYRDLKQNEGGPEHNEIKEGECLYEIEKGGYILIGIIGIKDVIRPEVPLAVQRCQSAGIKVRMVTGDNLITAKAIAKECGILTEELANLPDTVMEGPAFYERMGGLICRNCKEKSPCDCNRKDVKEGVKNLEAFKSIQKNLRVLARSRPEDKYLLVTGLRELGEIVAVTGDGTNDAPALKKADVGFAMGITGTEIAKHAADIIIMDDNFASIVKACMWGRNVYDNIRKFLQFQITVSLVALFTAFIGSVVLQDSPLQAIQLLWVNLIIDSLAALALATEPPTLELLNRPPQGRDEYIISRKMLKQIIPMATYLVGIMWAICFAGEKFFPEPDVKFRFDRPNIPYVYPGRRFDWDGTPLFSKFEKDFGASRHLSNVFNIFVVMCIFNIFNARIINDKLNIFKGMFNNLTYVFIVIFICGAQVLIMFVGGPAMKITSGGVHGYHWLIAVILGFTTWIFGALFKFIPDNFCPQFGKKNNQTDDEEAAQDGAVKKSSSQIKRQGSSLRRVRGSFRNHGQAHLPAEGERFVLEKNGSQQRKQQSGQNLAPSDKEYK